MIFAITGANGFVGKCLSAYLLGLGYEIRLICRPGALLPSRLESYCWRGQLSDQGFLRSALSGVDVVFHLAARAHVLDRVSEGLENLLVLDSNFENSRSVFRSSYDCGVKRIVFLSSVAVLGSFTLDKPFDDSSPPRPIGMYGVSKYLSECVLKNDYSSGTMDWVVIRPPLVYGKGAPGNLKLLKTFMRRMPLLPFGALDAPKSYVSIDSLVRILVLVSNGQAYSRQTFLVSDPGVVTFSRIASSYLSSKSLPGFLNVSVPSFILFSILALLGKSSLWRKIDSKLLVDSSRFSTVASWRSSVKPLDVLVNCFSDG